MYKNKYENKHSAIKRDFEDNYVNRKLQKRLGELIYSRGLTEIEVCSYLGIHIKSWEYVRRGIRRPSQEFIARLMELLGDEVLILFLGYYMDDEFPKIVSALEFETDPMRTMMQKR